MTKPDDQLLELQAKVDELKIELSNAQNRVNWHVEFLEQRRALEAAVVALIDLEQDSDSILAWVRTKANNYLAAGRRVGVDLTPSSW